MAADARARLDAVGLSPPLPLLLLHGWSPGPGLPGSLLASGLFTVHNIDASTVLTIATNRWAAALVAVLVGCAALIVRLDGAWFAWSALLPALLLAWWLKKRAVAFCLDEDVAEAARAIARLRPAAVVGYSWGGAIATFLLERGLWAGPTLLLAPAGGLLAVHAGRPAPSLANLRSLPPLTLVHGESDAIVAAADSFALAQTAPGADKDRLNLVMGADDHFLWRLAPRRQLEAWLLEMLTAADR